ncbi:hypothetical protein A3SI_05237 [Nitritalea halalkaliphila LW7]|uniref:6-bladed beta-propeller n=1 Tax=Nitritalea halalkaliphila LW7 TaxID=1189621 RepID=I5C7Q4_9BACT|nr:6-bladed beta-propeller [Nitritalea halalkaliphila]EIM77856.1 hypothetical protein A3SI_05237 [Nitritalea halalkaliphila LW7]
MNMTHFRALLLCICCLHIHFFSHGQKVYPSAADASPDLTKITVRSQDILEDFTVTRDKLSEHCVVPLEVTDASLIGKIDKVIRHEGRIFVLDRDLAQTVFCFDLQGRFLFKLGGLGKGPGEYRELRDIVLYPSTNEIGVLQGEKIIWYNTGDGAFTGATTELENIVLDKVSLLDPTRLIGYANNQCFSKENCSKFYSFTKDAEILNRYLPIEKQEKNLYVDHENPFSGSTFSIGFTHILNDTIYTINGHGRMVPKVWLDFTDMASNDKFELPESTKQYKKWLNKTVKNKTVKGLIFYHETNDVIQFKFRRGVDLVWGLFLKETNKLILSENIFADEVLFINSNVGIYKDTFISYFSSEIVLQISEFLPSAENEIEDLINTYGRNFYDYMISLDGVANPILVFSKFKNDL